MSELDFYDRFCSPPPCVQVMYLWVVMMMMICAKARQEHDTRRSTSDRNVFIVQKLLNSVTLTFCCYTPPFSLY